MPQVFETIAENGVIHLPDDVPASAHCVVTVLEDDVESLRAQAKSMLPDAKQQRMSELLEKNRNGTLTTVECEELDELAAEFDSATLAKGRALAALAIVTDSPPQD